MIYQNSKQLLLYLKAQMATREIKTKELASKMNKSQSATSAAFKQGNISLDALNDIAQALDYDIEINFIPKDDVG